MKSLLIFTAILFFNQGSIAGDKKGNGGDIIVCQDQEVQSFDLYELNNRYFHNIEVNLDSWDNQNEVSIAKRILKYNFPSHPIVKEELLRRVEKFYSKVRFSKTSLGDVQDTGNVEFPNDCRLQQVVNRNEEILPEGKDYLVDEKIWESLNQLDKASLILHEVIYQALETETSEPIRKFVSYLFANELLSMSTKELVDFFKEIGFKSFYLDNLYLDLTESFNFFDDNELKSAKLLKGSKIIWNTQEVELQEERIVFYKDKSLKSFCPKSEISIQVNNQVLHGNCYSKDSYVTFHSNGLVKQLANTRGYYFQNNFEIFFSPNLSSLNKIEFYQDGLIKTFESNHVTLFTPNNSHIKVSPPFLVDDKGMLRIATLKAPFFYNNATKIKIPIKGDLFIGKNGNILKATLDQNLLIESQRGLFWIAKNFPITFYPSGEIQSGFLLYDFTYKKDNNLKTIKQFERISLTRELEILSELTPQ